MSKYWRRKSALRRLLQDYQSRFFISELVQKHSLIRIYSSLYNWKEPKAHRRLMDSSRVIDKATVLDRRIDGLLSKLEGGDRETEVFRNYRCWQNIHPVLLFPLTTLCREAASLSSHCKIYIIWAAK